MARADRDQQSAGAHSGGGSRESRTAAGTNRDRLGGVQVTGYGAPIHNNAYGSFAQSPGTWGVTNEKVNTYNQAARNWNASAQHPSLQNAINNMQPFGFSMQAPQYGQPKTYTGGDYHLGVNPGGLIGSIGGMASMIPGVGMALGGLLGKGYTAMGGQNAMLSGPAVPGNWASPTGPMTGPPAQQGAGQNSQMAGRPGDGSDHLQQLASLTQGVSGIPTAPRPVGAQPQAAAGPNYTNIMGGLSQVTPGYGVQLPGYQYRGRATV